MHYLSQIKTDLIMSPSNTPPAGTSIPNANPESDQEVSQATPDDGFCNFTVDCSKYEYIRLKIETETEQTLMLDVEQVTAVYEAMGHWLAARETVDKLSQGLPDNHLDIVNLQAQ